MLRDGHLMRLCDRSSIAIALALLAGGCSAGGFGGPAATTPDSAASAAPASTSLTDKISNFFSGSSARSQQGVTGTLEADLDCPMINIRQGASTLPIPPPTGDNATMSLKYQGTFVRAARECAMVNKQMVMKVGIEGRLIVGPAGGPGQVDVPLRIAVVEETTAGTKPIVTKFIRLPVIIGPGAEGATFTHIEEGMTFPMPSAADLDDYVIYIGFDPLTAAAQDKQNNNPKPKPKAKPKAGTG
jgi:hypothetical protein